MNFDASLVRPDGTEIGTYFNNDKDAGSSINATHWSRSEMAEAVGVSPTNVGRIRAEAGLKSHLTHGFMVSNDPKFEEIVTDVVALYLYPHQRTICAEQPR